MGDFMKLNNHGWGTKEFVFSIVAILVLLLIAAFNVHKLYSSLAESPTDNYSNNSSSSNDDVYQTEPIDEGSKNDDVLQREYNEEHYIDYENAVVEASRSYVINYSPTIPGEGLRIDLETLVENNYVNNLYDMIDGSLCRGYSIVFLNSDDSLDIRAYLSCSNYVTEGY